MTTPFKFSKTETLKGDFESFVDHRLYYGTKDKQDIKATLTPVKAGQYLKVVEAKIPGVSWAATFGIKLPESVKITESITLSKTDFKTVVETPSELKDLCEFKEVFTCKREKGGIKYSIAIEGKLKVNALVKSYAESTYAESRVGIIRSDIIRTAPPVLSSGYDIPQ